MSEVGDKLRTLNSSEGVRGEAVDSSPRRTHSRVSAGEIRGLSLEEERSSGRVHHAVPAGYELEDAAETHFAEERMRAEY